MRNPLTFHLTFVVRGKNHVIVTFYSSPVNVPSVHISIERRRHHNSLVWNKLHILYHVRVTTQSAHALTHVT